MNTSRISYASGVFAIAIAVAIDTLQLGLEIALVGLLLDSIITVVAALGFGIWFSHKGVHVASPDRSLKFCSRRSRADAGINGILPTWTYFVASTVWKEWHSEAGL